MSTKSASFGAFQLAILDALACLGENMEPDSALSFLSGYLHAAGYEIIAEAMIEAQRRMRLTGSTFPDDPA